MVPGTVLNENELSNHRFPVTLTFFCTGLIKPTLRTNKVHILSILRSACEYFTLQKKVGVSQVFLMLIDTVRYLRQLLIDFYDSFAVVPYELYF